MYQPAWSNGKEVGTGRRDANGRYQAIAAYLRDNEVLGDEPLTVLDFGAYGGYFSARLAEEFGARGIAVDSDPRLARQLAGVPGFKAINQRLTHAEIAELGHFNVVLALSVLHHLPEWREYLQVLTAAGEVVFVETANPAESLPKAAAHRNSRAIDNAVRRLDAQVITETAGYDNRHQRPLYVIDQRTVHVETTDETPEDAESSDDEAEVDTEAVERTVDDDTDD